MISRFKNAKTKYGNHITVVDNVSFHSKKEATRYQALKLMQASNLIAYLELQPKFKITVKDKFICHYSADFAYKDVQSGNIVYEDVKGFKTPVYRLKKKLTEALYNIKITEIWSMSNAVYVKNEAIIKMRVSSWMIYAWSKHRKEKLSVINVWQKEWINDKN